MNRHERRRAAAQLRAKVVQSVTVLDRTEAHGGKCDLCHKVTDDLRPYGPKGEWICFSCGMKDEPTTMAMLRRHVFGEPTN